MKLRKIEIAGFRGFNTRQEIQIIGELVLISGGNGNGKTSLVEALEWVLFGYTSRRLKGDALSRREHDDSYRNTHFPNDQEAFVSATFEVDDSTHTVKRVLNPDESFTLELDGARVADLSSLRITSDRQKPFVIQHGLRDFIFSRPIDRYRVLSGMLGLDDLIQFRDAAERSKTDYRNTTDPDVQAARSALRGFRQRIRSDDKLVTLDPLLEDGSEKQREFLSGIIAASGTATRETSEDITLHRRRLQAALDHAGDRVFNVDTLRPQPFGDHERTDLDEKRNILAKSSADRLATLAEDLQRGAKEYDADRIRFLSLGLKFLNPEDPSRCPFCLQRTLTNVQVEQYRSEVTEAEKGAASIRPVADRVCQEARELLVEMDRILVRTPSKEIRAKLQSLLVERTGLFDQYFGAVLKIARARRQCRQILRRFEATLAKIIEAERHRIFDEEPFKTYERNLLALHDLAHRLEKARSGYESVFSTVETALMPMISTDKEVAHLTLLSDVLDQWDDIERGLRDIDVAKRLQELVRQTREFIERKQKEILDNRNDALVGWYELLNPNEQIRFKGIDIATDSLLLKAESYGSEISAAATLSEAHLNCLGLSVFLMQAIDASLPYRFIIIDDPIQSMDQDHQDRFEDELLSKLLEGRYQVVLLSHLYTFIDRVRGLHNLPYCLEFAGYEKSGPVIREDVPALRQYLTSAKKCKAAAGREYRRECCMFLRLLVERFCKELYILETGDSVPRSFQEKSFDALRDLLRQTSCHPDDERRLKNTFDFVVSSHHDDETKEPPTQGQLETHVSRLEGLIKKYNIPTG